MESNTIFLYIIAVAALCFALINGICFLLKRNKSAKATGVITSVKMPNPETSKARNSKWAKVSYNVNGKSYQSANRIQVSMTSQIGTPVTVCYDIFNPEKLYSFSVSRIIVSLIIAAICIIAAVFKLV